MRAESKKLERRRGVEVHTDCKFSLFVTRTTWTAPVPKMSSTAGSSAVTPTSTLNLLTNLPLGHPSFENLLVTHSPLAYPSTLPSQQVNKLVGRINAAILARDNEYDRRVSWRISKEIILQDTEGYALTNWGKGWLNAALTAVTVSGLIHTTLTSRPRACLSAHLSTPYISCPPSSLILHRIQHSREKPSTQLWVKSHSLCRVYSKDVLRRINPTGTIS